MAVADLLVAPPALAWAVVYASYAPQLPTDARGVLAWTGLVGAFLFGLSTLITTPFRLGYRLALIAIYTVLMPLLMFMGVIFAVCSLDRCF